MRSNTEIETLTVSFEVGDGALVGRICGPLDLATAPALEIALDERLAGSGARTLVLDLSEVSFLGCSGAAVLVKLARRVEGQVCLTGVRGAARRTLELVEILNMFQVRDTVDEALRRVGRRR